MLVSGIIKRWLAILPYEIYNPIVAIDVAAENATELPKLGRPRQKLRKHASHTECNIGS